MKALKAFIKPFEAPQRSVGKKLKLTIISIQLSEIHGAGRVNILVTYNRSKVNLKSITCNDFAVLNCSLLDYQVLNLK